MEEEMEPSFPLLPPQKNREKRRKKKKRRRTVVKRRGEGPGEYIVNSPLMLGRSTGKKEGKRKGGGGGDQCCTLFNSRIRKREKKEEGEGPRARLFPGGEGGGTRVLSFILL